MKGACALKSGLCSGLQESRRQGAWGIGNDGVPEEEEGVGAPAARRSSQRTVDSVLVVGDDVWRRGGRCVQSGREAITWR